MTKWKLFFSYIPTLTAQSFLTVLKALASCTPVSPQPPFLPLSPTLPPVESCCVIQVGLKLLESRDAPSSAPRSRVYI